LPLLTPGKRLTGRTLIEKGMPINDVYVTLA